MHPQQSALNAISPQGILDIYLSDVPAAEIAKRFGISHQAVYAFLLRHAPDAWHECQVARALARKESAEDDLDSMRRGTYSSPDGEPMQVDGVAVALARERLKAAQWDLERVCRRIYGDRIEVTGANGRDLHPAEDSLDLIKARLVDLVATVRLRDGQIEEVFEAAAERE